MKKLATLVAVLAALSTNSAFAQGNSNNNNQSMSKQQMMAAKNGMPGKCCVDNSFQWGIGLVGLAVMGVVVGLTASAATDGGSSHSNSND